MSRNNFSWQIESVVKYSLFLACGRFNATAVGLKNPRWRTHGLYHVVSQGCEPFDTATQIVLLHQQIQVPLKYK